MTTYLGSLSWPDKGISPCSPSLCVEDRAEMPCGKGSLVCVWLLCQSHAHHPQSQPLFELRCSNNVVHVHSCADSCALLVNLLQYVTSSGDLHPPPQPPSPTEIAGQKLSESPASLPSCLPVETALINQRDLTDALLDTERRSLRELAQSSGQ